MARPIGANFGVYAFSDFARPTAQSYYRIAVPLKSLYRSGLANIFPDNGKGNRDQAIRSMLGADIALGWNLTDEVGLSIARDFAGFPNGMENGTLRLPPILVNDMDDAVEWVHPLNESYAKWGIRNWHGEVLAPGTIEDPTRLVWPGPNGTTKDLWVDKVTMGINDEVWDIERNLQTIEAHYEIARLAAGVTVTTEALAQCYRDQGVKEVYVYPNSIIEDDYLFPNLAPHDDIRILWQGSTSHFEDWMPLLQVMADVANENPKVKYIFWGCMPTMLKRLIKNPAQIEFHEWVEYTSYKLYRACMDADINLCPLLDSPFNRCKSAIKWYEGSVGPRPEATLAQNVGPYKEIEDGKTGLLFDTPQDFKEKLLALVKNTELRRILGDRAREWVRTNRAADKTVIGLFEFYEHLKSKQRREALLAR
jgi:glycosyltransferase involved in cell wall biosynthesis